MFCHHCNFEIPIKRRLGREQICPNCGEHLHCCLNCLFYSETAYHQCREEQAEWVTDKKFPNYCDYFKPGDRQGTNQNKRAEEARKKLDQLFKKSDS